MVASLVAAILVSVWFYVGPYTTFSNSVGGVAIVAGSAAQTSEMQATFKIGREKLYPRKGTAKLKVRVPGPGRLSLRGKGLAKQRPLRVARDAVTLGRKVKGGKVRLLVKPKGKAKRRLDRRGKTKIKGRVTFTPTGGSPSTQVKYLKLRERL